MTHIAWALFAACAVWFISERKKPRGKKVSAFMLIVPLVSWFFFSIMHRAVIASKGTQLDALLAGALFGGIVLAVCLCIEWLVTRKRRVP
jgi:hypothetical protein